MGYAKNLYNKLVVLPHLTEMFPLMFIKGDHTVVAKDGTYSSVLSLSGLDYTGMKTNQYDLLYNIRKRLFEKESPFYRLDIVSKKNRVSAKDKIDTDCTDPILGLLKRTWQGGFDTLYRSKHYLTISVNNNNLLSKVGAMVSDDYKINKDEELTRLIDEIKSELSDYSPELLTNDALSSYYAAELNGRETYINAKKLGSMFIKSTCRF